MIKLAVIGCGHWGPNHIRTFSSLPGSRVDTVVDLDKKRLEYVREMYPGLRYEHDYRRIISDPEIDAVVVATPIVTHYQIVRESILEGKHVLCEKPLCKETKQGEELVELAHANGRSLMVGHVFLFNPGIVKLRELVGAGELGKIHYLSASRANLGKFLTDANVSWDLCSHDISIFNWLLDSEPEVVSATGSSYVRSGIEDVAFVSMRYPKNVLTNIHVSWLDPKKVRQMTVVGNQQMATWDDLQMASPIAIYDRGASAVQDYGDFGEYLHLSMWDGDIRLPKVPFDEPLKLQAVEFLESLRDGRHSRSDGGFGLGVVRALEAIDVSMQQGGSPTRVSPNQSTL